MEKESISPDTKDWVIVARSLPAMRISCFSLPYHVTIFLSLTHTHSICYRFPQLESYLTRTGGPMDVVPLAYSLSRRYPQASIFLFSRMGMHRGRNQGEAEHITVLGLDSSGAGVETFHIYGPGSGTLFKTGGRKLYNVKNDCDKL
ncbi:hypothetical protein BDQ17DRAFT_1334509 [Cyathus striatus]|nr:hypothetical protein BDQ17DRAFT_1334509 [Cyathus striatus]